LIYSAIDTAPDFYKGTAEKASRSWMNVTMRLPTEDMEDKFIADAKKEGLLGIKGHRSVGGIRFSIYNAVSLEDVKKAVDFMGKFHKSA
jgi:phosphoserine aminotransferase